MNNELILPGMKDSEFERVLGTKIVPMTKEEIREIVLCKLKLTKDSILWDIGAGTGSISIEAARLCSEGSVYSFERDSDALTLLEKNKAHFEANNMYIVPGDASETIKGRRKPTHVVVGGSGGYLEDILEQLMLYAKQFTEKYDGEGRHVMMMSPIRVVVPTVTLETQAALNKWLAEHKLEAEVLQIQVSRAKPVGAYHMWRAENPVTLYDFTLEM